MFSTAVNGLLLAVLMLLPTGAPSSSDDSRDKDVEDRVIVRLNDEDLDIEGDDPVIVRVGRGAFMGVRLIGITEELRAHYGAPRGAGVLVSEVESGSPAARAGIEVGDVIVAVDGERADSGRDVSRAIRRKKGGEAVEVELVRGRATRKVTVTLEERRAREREIDLGDLGDDLRHRTWVFRDGDWKDGRFKMPRFRIENLEDLPALSERLEELEKRLGELEKKLAK